MALTLGLSLAPAVHGGGHDPDCDPAVIVHDSSQHRIAGSRSGSDRAPSSDHCLTCHLFRLSRDTGGWRHLPQELDVSSQLHQSLDGLLSSEAAVPLSARAPPIRFRA